MPTLRPTTSKRFAALAAVALLLTAAGPGLLAETVSSGTWSKKSFAIQGSWTLESNGDGYVLVLDDEFKTKSAPDLKLFLSKQDLAAANGKNATRDAVLIAELDKNKGGQRYALPAGVDPADFKTLLLHCEKYSKLWGGAPLN